MREVRGSKDKYINLSIEGRGRCEKGGCAGGGEGCEGRGRCGKGGVEREGVREEVKDVREEGGVGREVWEGRVCGRR